MAAKESGECHRETTCACLTSYYTKIIRLSLETERSRVYFLIFFSQSEAAVRRELIITPGSLQY